MGCNVVDTLEDRAFAMSIGGGEGGVVTVCLHYISHALLIDLLTAVPISWIVRGPELFPCAPGSCDGVKVLLFWGERDSGVRMIGAYHDGAHHDRTTTMMMMMTWG
eukprot:809072-Rhodomonas_salina.2